jgi:hypothetical protein
MLVLTEQPEDLLSQLVGTRARPVYGVAKLAVVAHPGDAQARKDCLFEVAAKWTTNHSPYLERGTPYQTRSVYAHRRVLNIPSSP